MRNQTLVAKNLTVARGDLQLCSPVNFSLSKGQILHIQGSNGIGKTALMMMLAGLIPLTDLDQTVLLWGDHIPEDWSVLYIGHLSGVNPALSVGENLRFMQAVNSDSCANLDEALREVGLSGYGDVTVSQLSSGQKRRVSLARLWLSDDAEPLWLLDEPFTALDAAMIKRLNDRLIQHTLKGGRVILTSHQPLNIPAEVLDLGQYAIQHHDVNAEWTSEC